MVVLNQDCEKAMKLTIPAVRVAVSESLAKEHGMSETEIARGFGIAQAAVSKYLNGNYSEKVRKIVKLIVSNRLHNDIVNAFLKGKNADCIARLVDEAASNKKIIKTAL